MNYLGRTGKLAALDVDAGSLVDNRANLFLDANYFAMLEAGKSPPVADTAGLVGVPSPESLAGGAIASDIINVGPTPQDTTRFVLASGNFTQNWSNVVLANDDWSNVGSIVGYRGDGLTASTGTDPQTLTANVATPVIDVNVGQTNPNTFTAGGVTYFTGSLVGNDAVVALAGSGTASAPYLQFYLDSTGRQDITVSFRARDLETSADNAVQQIAVQYRTNPTGAWTNLPGGYIADATSGPNIAGPDSNVSVILPSAANNQSQLEVRIITTNAVGNDEWVGIDDIVISSSSGATSVTVNDVSITEGNSGTSLLTFTITRSDNAGAFTLNYATADATATAGSDYVAASGTATFTAGGALTQTVSVTINGDTTPEANETFQLNLSNLVNTSGSASITDAQGIGTINNDDATPPSITINDVSIVEGNAGTSIATFTVTRTGGIGAFAVDFTTANGTATAGSDYVATSGTLNFGVGVNTQTVSITINGDTAPEPNETFFVNLTNATNATIIADGQGQGTITNDDLTLISQIQGDSYYSPLLRASGVSGFNVASSFTVTVQAIVTALDGVGNRQGFYIQEELADQDGNPFTSEGIFVLTRTDGNVGSALSAVAPTLRVGDLVTLTANIQEYQGFNTNLPITALVNPTSITINSSGNTLPTIILDASVNIPNQSFTRVTPDFTDSVDDPGDSFDAANYGISFWETVEGSLVSIPNVRVADGFVSTSGGQPFFKAYSEDHANPEQINSRGGYTIAGDPALSPPNTPSLNDDVLTGGRVLSDGDTNPDIFEVDFTGFATAAPAGLGTSATVGDRLGNLTGIIDFDFQELKLYVTNFDAASIQTSGQPAPEVATFTPDSRQLTFATFNVQNLDPTDGAARFTALAQAIATNLKAPDILSIEEIQDNNGAAAGDGTNATGTDASTTWQMLVDALNFATGQNYQWVDELPVYNAEGGELSGNIRVGFLYNTNRVQLGDLAANATIAERRQFTDRIGDGVRDAGDRIQYSDNQVTGINTADWSGTRRSLLGQFTFRGETVFVAANHFPSKGGSGNFWQFNQSLETGNPTNAGFDRRNAVAEDLYTVLNYIQTNSPNVGVISGGDYNEFYFYRALEAATGYVNADGTARNDGLRLTNLTTTLPEAERYTYTFDGRSQAIDHILVNQQLADIASYDVVHINTGYNASGTGANASPALSDHDPAVVQLDYRQRAETLNGTAASETINGFGGNDIIDGRGGTDTLIGGLGDDLFFVDSLDDVVTENAGEGFDEVRTSVANYVLPANVERLVYTGTANQNQSGNSGDNQFTGGSGNDSYDLSQGGNDTVNGGDGNDSFFFGAAFDANDNVDGGTGTNDQIGLQGNYAALTLGANSTRNVEVLAVLPGAGFSYNITTIDANVAAGQELVIFGTNLGATNNLTFNGSAETDGNFRVYGGLGVDNITTGAGNDGIYFGPGRFSAGDFVNGGAGTNDQVALDGNYTATISATQLQNVELLALLRGVTGDLANYNITLADNLIGAGQTFTVFGLAVETGFTLNATAETNGNVNVFGGSGNETIATGAGADRIFGGGGADILNGGAGADTFVYDAVSQSTGATYDRITGFVSGTDRFDFDFTVTGVDATVGAGTLSTASFDANLAAVIGSGQLAANHAVLFQANAGDLAGLTFLVVDANGVAGYQAGSDYVIQLTTPPASLVTGDFI
ncbi:MAG: hypothetical protein K2Y20_12720 [Sphingomonas sp.]|nr:hypothetical protein [Sphingomonas sp.]